MMEPQRIEGDTPLSVTMKAAQWEELLKIIGKSPYEQVVGMIQAIVGQCMVGAERATREADQD